MSKKEEGEMEVRRNPGKEEGWKKEMRQRTVRIVQVCSLTSLLLKLIYQEEFKIEDFGSVFLFFSPQCFRALIIFAPFLMQLFKHLKIENIFFNEVQHLNPSFKKGVILFPCWREI